VLKLLLIALAAMATLCRADIELRLVDDDGKAVANAVLLIDGVPAQAAGNAVMDQRDMQFVPHVLAIAAGAQVNFPNGDDIRHHVYSFSAARRFELRLFKGDEAPPVQFDTPGIVVLGCNIHDQMLGYILVTDSPRFAVSDADGRVRLADLEPRTATLRWWHPSLGEAAPRTLGSVDLGVTSELMLGSVVQTSTVPKERAPSSLQSRFRKGAERAEN
jgi:plastocyanin